MLRNLGSSLNVLQALTIPNKTKSKTVVCILNLIFLIFNITIIPIHNKDSATNPVISQSLYKVLDKNTSLYGRYADEYQ